MKVPVKKILFVVCIQLVIASIHIFRLGQIFNGELYNLYYGYFSDIILPFGGYFLLSMYDYQYKFLRHWGIKAIIVFSLTSTCEILQYFGIYALGVTFDPLDIVMYGSGVLLAAFVDTRVFAKIFRFWVIDYDNEVREED